MERRAQREPRAGEKPGSFFDRPLWRILIPLILLSAAIHRGAVAVIVHAHDAGSTFVLAGYALQAILLLAAAVAIFLGWPALGAGKTDR